MTDIYRLPGLQTPNLHYIIRSVKLSDVDQLHEHIWQDRKVSSISEFIQRIIKLESQYRGIGIVVTDDLQETQPIVAYGQVTQWIKCAEISDLMVVPAYRGRGIGTAMIQYLARFIAPNADCIELGVAQSNPRALTLYRRLGFEDSYTVQLDLGRGSEPVIYLQINLTPDQ